MKKENYISTTQLSDVLGISRVAVFKKIKSGEIKATKIGRNFIIDKKDLPEIFGDVLTSEKKKIIEDAVKKTVKEYGQTIKLLGQE